MRRAAKRDANERAIVDALRMIPGCDVVQINQDKMPDLDVGFRGVNYKLEVKDENGKLTPGQQEFFETWPGQCAIVRSIDDALRVIGVVN